MGLKAIEQQVCDGSQGDDCFSKTHIEQLKALGAFAGMADTSQVALF